MAEEYVPETIVQYMSDNSGYRCGYCKSADSNFSHGMWAHTMSADVYESLLDRGWRRSGHYCYKPTMERICCPAYTIRCEALNFKLSKSQKKVLKRMNRFLSFGSTKTADSKDPSSECIGEESSSGITEFIEPKFPVAEDLPGVQRSKRSRNEFSCNAGISKQTEKKAAHFDDISDPLTSQPTPGSSERDVTEDSNSKTILGNKCARLAAGPDPNRPLCKKAKVIRQERREAKLVKTGAEAARQSKNKDDAAKSVEDFLSAPFPSDPAHRLKVCLVRSQPPSAEFQKTFKAELSVYEKYQMIIHKDKPKRCNEKQFRQFLCNSPLEPKYSDGGPSHGYGSFHQQYWLGDKLIAVGVIDILPQCVSSVYLFYDPDFSFLSLGTYSSLQEIAFVRSLHSTASAIKYYYMGYYIHSCPKMRYKGQYSPSLLLCPETYVWFPLDHCVKKLDASKYARFNEDMAATDPEKDVELDMVLCLYRHMPMSYGLCRRLCPGVGDEKEVQEYAQLVGSKCVSLILLYRS